MKNTYSCTEELLRSLPQPIAIVADGAFVGPMGPAIDHHPSVVRMNKCRTAGFEALVGTRTTVRCIAGGEDVDPHPEFVEFSPFTRDANESSAVAGYEQRSGTTLVCARTDVHALLPQVQEPSTGLALAVLCNQLGLAFSLFGFDDAPSDPELALLLTLKHGVFYGPIHAGASFASPGHVGSERLPLYQSLGIVIQNETILEFGAGHGDLSAFIESQGNAVTALETSPVAFDRIPVRKKLRGDCLTLAGIGETFDRFVSVDVLQFLTENDIRLVLREAARLAGSVLVSVSTRFSGLQDQNGGDSHLTVHSAEWWHRLFAEHFEVNLMTGQDVGQLILAGDRRAPGAAPAARPVAAPDHFELPAGYTARAKPAYYPDLVYDGRTWQPDVYPTAAEIARALHCDTLIDIGCGHARKLGALHPEFKLIGVDYGANIDYCRKQFQFGTWLEADFENIDLLPLPAQVLAKSVVICSDVIEHLVDPRSLMDALRQLLVHAPALVLSTPDRQRTWGTAHNGPPPNHAHTREWSVDELSTLLQREGFSLAAATHTRSNDGSPDLATILIVAVNLEHPMIRGSKLFDAAMAAKRPVADPPVAPLASPIAETAAPVQAAALPKLGAARSLQAATAAAGAQAMADPTWRQRLALARSDSETLHVLAKMSLTLGHPDRSVDLYGALLSANGSDSDALEGVVVAQIRCGQHAAAARLLASMPAG